MNAIQLNNPPAPIGVTLAYCDYIANLISIELLKEDKQYCDYLQFVSRVRMDLSPEGYFASTKKTLRVCDHNGKNYKVTVEEMHDEVN